MLKLLGIGPGSNKGEGISSFRGEHADAFLFFFFLFGLILILNWYHILVSQVTSIEPIIMPAKLKAPLDYKHLTSDNPEKRG
jgi:hypothetical protein